MSKLQNFSPAPNETAKPHKPVAAITALVFLVNGALLYLVSEDSTGSGGIGLGEDQGDSNKKTIEKTIEKPEIFYIKRNEIIYRGKKVDFPNEFKKLLTEIENRKQVPEIVFHRKTYNSFRKKVEKLIQEEDILVRYRKKRKKQN